MVAAFTFGAAARWVLAPAPGSWDMDYFRVWVETAVDRGVTGAYGPPLERSALEAALGNAGPLWAPHRGDRIFNIDYPPLAMAVWRGAAALVDPEDDVSWNLALKLPAMAGDVAAVLLLAFFWPGGEPACARPRPTGPSRARGCRAPPSVISTAPTRRSCSWPRSQPRTGRRGWPARRWRRPRSSSRPRSSPRPPSRSRCARRGASGSPAWPGSRWWPRCSLPFALDGTAGAAIAQVRKILSQERLSAGYANPWWIAGALVTGQFSHVPVLRLDAVPFPARAIGLCALAAAMALIARGLSRDRTQPRTVVACGALFAAYAVLATSVHTNHPHPLALLLVAALAVGAVARAPALALVLGYAVNILFEEGLGRVAGPRYGMLERVDTWLDALRFGAGFDLTLVLAVVHTLAFALLLRGLVRHRSHTPKSLTLIGFQILDQMVKYRLE